MMLDATISDMVLLDVDATTSDVVLSTALSSLLNHQNLLRLLSTPWNGAAAVFAVATVPA